MPSFKGQRRTRSRYLKSPHKRATQFGPSREQQVSLGMVPRLTSGDIENELRAVDLMIANMESVKQENLKELQDYLRAKSHNKSLDEKIEAVLAHDRAQHPIAHLLLVEYGKAWSDDAKIKVAALNADRVPLPPRRVPNSFHEFSGEYYVIIEPLSGWVRYTKLVRHCSPVQFDTKKGEFGPDGKTDMLKEFKARLEAALPKAIEQKAKRRMRAKEKEAREARIASNNAAKEVEKHRVKAAAAAHFGTTRRLAKGVRKKILDQMRILSECPYCGGPLGDEPHADHIYPVSHGGFSTPENMVFICNGCNTKKSDKTLREFVKLMNLDWSGIEVRLEMLGKRF